MAPSLYIHIPFCKRKCFYCNFYSDVYFERTASSYIDALVTQIDGLKNRDFKKIGTVPAGDCPYFSTIYIGGGTPSSLDRKFLTRLLKSLETVKRYSSRAGLNLPYNEALLSNSFPEFTIEANPESLDEDKMKLFLDSGVNRLSIGVQSLRDEKLKKLGRIHTAKRAIDSVHLASKKGIKNISIDLMFGIWGEDIASWKKELTEAVRLPITHVSCYELTYEKGTPLFLALKNKSVTPLEDDAVAAMYELAIDELALRGIKQYEVSNFAKAGCECRHNINYWENNEYIGLGPSAVSYMEGVRSKNISDIKEYLRKSAQKETLTESIEKLSPLKRAKETAAIKIRTKEGIDFTWFKDKTGFDFQELEKNALKDLLEKDLIKYKKETAIEIGSRGLNLGYQQPVAITGVVLKRKGFLFCDTVSSAML